MERTLRRRLVCRALIVCAVTAAACAEAPTPKADSTCADYREALDVCMGELGLEHGLGRSVAHACVPDALTANDRAYFQCVTEVLDRTLCDLPALPTVREAVAACHAKYVDDAGGAASSLSLTPGRQAQVGRRGTGSRPIRPSLSARRHPTLIPRRIQPITRRPPQAHKTALDQPRLDPIRDQARAEAPVGGHDVLHP
jgi:hypothetical protein